MEFQIFDLFQGVVAELGHEREAVVAGGLNPSARAGSPTGSWMGRPPRPPPREPLGVGDRATASLSPFNSNEYGECHDAAFKLRAVPVNLNYQYVADELHYHFRGRGARRADPRPGSPIGWTRPAMGWIKDVG